MKENIDPEEGESESRIIEVVRETGLVVRGKGVEGEREVVDL